MSLGNLSCKCAIAEVMYNIFELLLGSCSGERSLMSETRLYRSVTCKVGKRRLKATTGEQHEGCASACVFRLSLWRPSHTFQN
jgi:hypothetical protein